MIRKRSTTTLISIVVLLATQALAGQILPMAAPILRVFIALVCVALSLFVATRAVKARKWLALLLLGISLAGLWIAPSAHMRLLAFAAWLASLSLFMEDPPLRLRIESLARGSLLAGCVVGALALAPSIQPLADQSSRALSGAISAPLGGAPLGAEAAGLISFLILVGFLLTARQRSMRSEIAVLTVLVGLLLVHVWVQGILVREGYRMLLGLAYVVAGSIVVALPEPCSHARCVLGRRPAHPATRRVAALVGIWALSFFVALVPAIGWEHPGQGDAITILDHGTLGSWLHPSETDPGRAFNEASFGLLDEYLEAHSFNVEIVSEINSEILEDSSAIIIINPGTPFRDEEISVILEAVYTGAGLLVMGDHTNLGGIMDHINGLLSPAGMGLRFDSAVAIHENWFGKLKFAHPFRLSYDARHFPVSVGASVWIAPTLTGGSLVTAERAFSDRGDAENTGQALLGNLVYDRGEAYGGLLLAASKHFGHGRIALFGDTSAFQIPSLPHSHGYLASLMSWLCAGPPGWTRIAGAVTALLLLVATAFVLSGREFSRGGGALLLVGAVALGFQFGDIGSRAAVCEPPLTATNLAQIDVGHNNLLSTEPLAPDGVDGLILNLAREGFIPIITERPILSHALGPGSLAAVTAPVRRMSENETGEYLAYLERGGHLLISAGFPNQEALAPLLSALAAGFENRPLGSGLQFEVARDDLQPRFVSAWPADVSPEWNELYVATVVDEAFLLVATRSVAEGGVLLIADPYFLRNSNLENREYFVPANVQMLGEWLGRIGEKPDD